MKVIFPAKPKTPKTRRSMQTGKTTSIVRKSRKYYPTDPDQYQLIDKIGQGGSAVVYKAQCLPWSEIVAIKCIDLDAKKGRDADLEAVAMESRTMRFSHHNILSAHCAFAVGTSLWVVMPFMAFGSLRQILKTSFPDGMEESAVATILREVLKGLDYLHRRGYIHRDVKAANILVDRNGAVKLADFGISVCLYDGGAENCVRRRRSAVGTISWMAPEVLLADERDDGYDWAADIWSFGITAMELATGNSPFARSEVDDMVSLFHKGYVPKLTRAKFSRSFKDMVSKCLVDFPEDRPSAEELLQHPFFMNHAKTANHIIRNVLSKLPPPTNWGKMLARDERFYRFAQKQDDVDCYVAV